MSATADSFGSEAYQYRLFFFFFLKISESWSQHRTNIWPQKPPKRSFKAGCKSTAGDWSLQSVTLETGGCRWGSDLHVFIIRWWLLALRASHSRHALSRLFKWQRWSICALAASVFKSVFLLWLCDQEAQSQLAGAGGWCWCTALSSVSLPSVGSEEKRSLISTALKRARHPVRCAAPSAKSGRIYQLSAWPQPRHVWTYGDTAKIKGTFTSYKW